MQLTLHPARLSGRLMPPPAKSIILRAVVCALFCAQPLELTVGNLCEDTAAALDCARALGFQAVLHGEKVLLTPPSQPACTAVLPCRDSAACLHFMLAACAARGGRYTFLLSPALQRRPHEPLLQLLRENGCQVLSGQDRLELSGRLCPGSITVDAALSSQYASALMMALPSLAEPSVLTLQGTVSRPYLDLTCAVLRHFGVFLSAHDKQWRIPASVFQSPGSLCPEPDCSAAAFFAAANLLGSTVSLPDMTDCLQGDRQIVPILSKMRRQENCCIDVSKTPDLLPILAVVAAVLPGRRVFNGVLRLKHKESDRIQSTRSMICALGGQAAWDGRLLEITGGPLHGGTVNSYGDHRIAMAAAIAATVCSDSVILQNAECVAKSYPNFWRDYLSLGGKADGKISGVSLR